MKKPRVTSMDLEISNAKKRTEQSSASYTPALITKKVPNGKVGQDEKGASFLYDQEEIAKGIPASNQYESTKAIFKYCKPRVYETKLPTQNREVSKDSGRASFLKTSEAPGVGTYDSHKSRDYFSKSPATIAKQLSERKNDHFLVSRETKEKPSPCHYKLKTQMFQRCSTSPMTSRKRLT